MFTTNTYVFQFPKFDILHDMTSTITKHCVKSVQIRTKKNFVSGHFSHSKNVSIRTWS